MEEQIDLSFPPVPLVSASHSPTFPVPLPQICDERSSSVASCDGQNSDNDKGWKETRCDGVKM